MRNPLNWTKNPKFLNVRSNHSPRKYAINEARSMIFGWLCFVSWGPVQSSPRNYWINNELVMCGEGSSSCRDNEWTGPVFSQPWRVLIIYYLSKVVMATYNVQADWTDTRLLHADLTYKWLHPRSNKRNYTIIFTCDMKGLYCFGCNNCCIKIVIYYYPIYIYWHDQFIALTNNVVTIQYLLLIANSLISYIP